MCYNCGCHNPQDDMGDGGNITEQTFENLSKEWNKPIKDTKKIVFDFLKKKLKNPHLTEMFEKAANAWGQDVTEAKKNTYDLLNEQTGK